TLLRTGEWECGFSIDGGWILVEDDSLCGGRFTGGMTFMHCWRGRLGRNWLHFGRANGNADFR
uniref:hypothetical protein n=1 Tax=Listeria monocytogenes TaxID=1639 RepID=UPI0021199AD6